MCEPEYKPWYGRINWSNVEIGCAVGAGIVIGIIVAPEITIPTIGAAIPSLAAGML